jgi:hypothetical protein
LLGDLFEALEGGSSIDREVGARAGSHLQIALEDRGASRGLDLLQANALALTVSKDCFAASGANVMDPIRLRAKHRDEIPLPVVVGHNHRE